MNTNDTSEKQRILYKDNVLVKTKYELSLTENKLYNLLLYKFQKEGNLLKCKITHNEIKEVIKNKEANTISGIHTILSKLSSKKILIEEVKANNKNSLWHHYNLINGYTYDDEFKDFEIQATEKIYTLLKQKFENGCYTPNNLNIFLNLNNYYAQRLYELLRLWSNTKSTVTYRIDELKDYFMLNSNYKEYGNFKRRIIVPAIKELNKNGLFEITMSENKCGRKVESIDFTIKDLDKRKYFTPQSTALKGSSEIKEDSIDTMDDINTKNITEIHNETGISSSNILEANSRLTIHNPNIIEHEAEIPVHTTIIPDYENEIKPYNPVEEISKNTLHNNMNIPNYELELSVNNINVPNSMTEIHESSVNAPQYEFEVSDNTDVINNVQSSNEISLHNMKVLQQMHKAYGSGHNAEIHKASYEMPIHNIDVNHNSNLIQEHTTAAAAHNLRNLANSISTVYPEETILNKASLRLLKIDFKGYDFTEGDLYMAYAEAEAMTMEKDNVEIIGVGSYQYFKAVLKSKISYIR